MRSFLGHKPQRRLGRHGSEPEIMMDVNTTPLIDVMLVLLVMLIITIPIQLHAVNLEMPVGAPPTNLPKPEKVQIDIDAEKRNFPMWTFPGNLRLQGDSHLVLSALLAALKEKADTGFKSLAAARVARYAEAGGKCS